MYSTQSPSTPFRRWAIFYIAVLALLTGWWLFEKMPDGREELTASLENTFQETRQGMACDNRANLACFEDIAKYYPSPHLVEYKNRTVKAHALALLFENQCGKRDAIERLQILQDSFKVLTDQDEMYAGATSEIPETNDHGIYYNNLKANQLLIQSQMLVTYLTNYTMSKIGCVVDVILDNVPGFSPQPLFPLMGEPFQAEIFLTHYEPEIKYKCTTIALLNEQPLLLHDDVAHLNTTFPTPGPHTLHVRFRRELCRDGSITEVSRDFQVNVLERCDSIPAR